MRLFRWFIVLLLAALAGSTLLPRWLPPEMRPDMFLMMALFAAMRAERHEAPALAWAAGLAKDLLSAGPLGEYALLYLLLGVLVLWLRGFMDTYVPLTQAILGGAAFALTEGAYGLLLCLARSGSLQTGTAAMLLTASIVNAIAAVLFMRLMDSREKWLGTKRRFNPLARP